MKIDSAKVGLRAARIVGVALAVVVLAGCSGEVVTDVERAESQVSTKEKAAKEAQEDFTAASEAFCVASKTYVLALDGYGDVLNDTAPTVGDVRIAGADLVEPREDAFDGAEEAVKAQQKLAVAEQELADARAALEQAQAGASSAPAETATSEPTVPPLAPAATVDRVRQAETEFAAAQGAITDETPLADASEQFNSAAVALELSWLRLVVDAGCASDEQTVEAEAAVRAYTEALQQDLAAAGYYAGAVDGIYGPQTVAAVEALQEASGLPKTGTVDKATADALQAQLRVLGGEAAQESLATTAAIQQTLKLVGFWDGAVDGVWTPELTAAVQAFQTELGVEPTGVVDAATVTAFQAAIAALNEPETPATPATPAPSPSASEG